nr:ORF2 [Torque teno Leptonychotes weddellii virus 3]
MAHLPNIGVSDVPDFDHPNTYKRLEAKWKQLVSREHRLFCQCGNYLFHFKWHSGGEEGDGHAEAAGGAVGGDITGEEGDITGTTGGEEDISDIDMLR